MIKVYSLKRLTASVNVGPSTRSFYVKKGDSKKRLCIMIGTHTEYKTDDPEIQKQIEAYAPIKKSLSIKTIAAVEKTNAPKNSISEGGETVEHPEIVDLNGAKDLLRSMGVHHMSLQTPEAILAQASAKKVSFPNIK